MNSSYVLLTGATGFIGHRVLCELVQRGYRCALTLRDPIESALERLSTLVKPMGLDLGPAISRGLVAPIPFDLLGELPRRCPVPISTLLHAAASTRFTADGTGEPSRTNVGGTQRLLDWTIAHGIREFHLVSSAYACGRVAISPEEPFTGPTPDFHNEYEQSKCMAEHLFHEAAADAGTRATVFRPSVVVGAFDTGEASKFDGFYLTVRATELLDRMYRDAPAADRHAIPLRIKGRPEETQNIVPVDYVAGMIAGIMAMPSLHGQTYHLVHPDPPTNGLIKRALELHFNIGGGTFVAPSAFDTVQLSEAERLFHDVSRPIEHYFVDSPRFERARAAAAERVLDINCPRYGVAELRRLFTAALNCGWRKPAGRRPVARPVTTPAAAVSECELYFDHFLPSRIPSSRIARMTAMDVTIQFIIEDHPDGQWLCTFERGQLRRVLRGGLGLPADFGYRADRQAFWHAISGNAHPQELFLGGNAEVFGDVERALKMAMILNAFSREHPCDRETLLNLRRRAC